MFDWLNEWISASPTSYLIILGLAVADILGVVPAETVIVTATLLAVNGGLLLVGVAAAAILGAVIGDNILYGLGRGFGVRLVGRLFHGQHSRERFDWARRQMHRHGSGIIVAGRFVPMGRTATMFAAGMLETRWRRFIAADLVAVVLWACYWVGATVLLGGALSQRQWLTILVSIGIGAVIGLVAEGIRRYAERRQQSGESA